jgi:UDP-N-acetylmuramoyl-L-alanyl-D-glutamate--2,6-diaminopimelate ligase
MPEKPLSEFVEKINPVEIHRFSEVAIDQICCQPGQINGNTLYAVIDEFLEYGQWIQGEQLYRQMGSGMPAALICEKVLDHFNGPQLIVTDSRKAVALASKHFFDRPDESMKIVAVTGTNGKTTTTHLVHQIASNTGIRAAALGTIGLYIDGHKHLETVYTTALSTELFETLSKLRDLGVEILAMEVSSHAIKLDRVYGLDIDTGVLTNLSRDHLDFHHTMEDYRNTKKSMFSGLKPGATAVVNKDDDLGQEILKARYCKMIPYGISTSDGLVADRVQCTTDGSEFRLSYRNYAETVRISLTGRFNVYNLLAAAGACLSLSIEYDQVRNASPKLIPVGGRFEKIQLPGNRTAIVDYAHTPDSLEKILQTIRGTNPSRVITVFGCGGDRDRGKRPEMGATAAEYSDLCVVTLDNPRREDPDAIITDILKGMPKKGVWVEPDRRKAIRKAYELSRKNDVILVAGKGHETYQIIGDQKYPFDDREELKCL